MTILCVLSDGGFGWLVLAGSMLVNLLVPGVYRVIRGDVEKFRQHFFNKFDLLFLGTVKSFGVLFMEFLEAFDASPSSALWIPALCYFLYSSLGGLGILLAPIHLNHIILYFI